MLFKGIPVKWTIKASASDITSCNGTLTVPQYGISKQLASGDNIIEFIPTETGNIQYSCSMGMVSSNITVVNDVSKMTNNEIKQAQSAGSSGSSSGGCCG